MTDYLLDRIDDLDRRVRRIDAELVELRALAQTTEPRPGRPTQAAPAPPPIPRAAPTAPAAPSRYEPVEDPSFWSRDVGADLRGAFGRIDRDVALADLFGAKALAWAGGVVTVLGVVFFFVLAVNRGWIGPELRVTFGAIASAAVLGAGLWLRRRFGETHSSLAAAGAGIAGGYATLLAATALYDLVPEPVALLLAALIAAVGLAVSLLWRAQTVAGLGLVGAMVVPALVAFDGGLSRVGTAFVALMVAAAGVVGVRMRWRGLLIAGAVASLPQIAALLANEDASHWSIVALAATFWILYAAIGVAEQLVHDSNRLDTLPATFVLGSGGFLVYSAAVLFGDDQGIAYLAAAALYAAGAFAIRREIGLLLGALALGAIAVGLADLLSGASLTYAWAAEGAVLAWAAQRFGRIRFQLAALVYLALAAGHALLFEASPEHLFRPFADPAGGSPTIAACALALFVVAWTTRGLEEAKDEPLAGLLAPVGAALRTLRTHEPVIRGISFTLSALLATYAASLGVLFGFQRGVDGREHAFELGHVTLTAAWAAVGLAALVVATLRRNDGARTIALLWLGVVVAKTVTFDLAELDHDLRSYAFLAVAGIVLAATVLLHELDERVRDIYLAVVGLVVSLGLAIAGGTDIAVGSNADGASVLLAGAAVTLLGAFELRRPRLRDVATLFWALGLATAATGEAMIVGGIPLVAIWTTTAVVLAAAGRVVRERRLYVAAATYLAAPGAYTLAALTPPRRLVESSLHPGTHLIALVLVVTATVAAGILARDDARLTQAARGKAFWLAGVMGVYALCLAILEVAERIAPGDDIHANFQRGHTAVSAFLGILGLALLYAGLSRRRAGLRVGGLALLGAILGKIFLYDLAALSSAARAVSFLAVGGALLLGGFFYQRLTASSP